MTSERKKQIDREWRQNNPERTRELNRRWADKNPEVKKKANANWYAKNREREIRKSKAKHVGITLEEYDRMYKEQDGKCWICGIENPPGGLGVDHCHSTGKIRGLLCRSCNWGLGRFKDNPEALRKAADYLERNK